MRAPRALLLTALAASLALAGCTSAIETSGVDVEALRESVQDARSAVEEAKREALEAKDRLERVRSLEAVREEKVTLALDVVPVEGRVTFVATNVTRSDGTTIPIENLTSLPRVTVVSDPQGWSFTCDPLTCAFDAGAGPVRLVWPDALEIAFPQGCAEGEAVCALRGAIVLHDATVRATSAVGDVTS